MARIGAVGQAPIGGERLHIVNVILGVVASSGVVEKCVEEKEDGN